MPLDIIVSRILYALAKLLNLFVKVTFYRFKMRFFAYHTSFSYEIMLAKDKCHAKSVVLRNVAFEGESANIGSMPYRGKDIMDFILRFLAMT